MSLCVCRSDGKAGPRLLLWVLIISLSSVRRPQIEKIVTLIGAGIEFSRDQHYATPGRVPPLLPPHAPVFYGLKIDCDALKLVINDG